MTIASASTLERLTTLINEFYVNTTYHIKDGEVYNSKGLCPHLIVTYKKKRFYVESVK